MATNCTDTLILQSSAEDISRFKTNGENVKEYDAYFKQQIVIAATNLFTTATNALQTHTSLSKVVILKQVPRYDSVKDDPLGTEKVLANLFDETLDQLLSSSSSCYLH